MSWLRFAPPISQRNFDILVGAAPEELGILVSQSPSTGLYSPGLFKGQNLIYALYPGFETEGEARTAMSEAVAKCRETKLDS
jgi:hypothetical protein